MTDHPSSSRASPCTRLLRSRRTCADRLDSCSMYARRKSLARSSRCLSGSTPSGSTSRSNLSRNASRPGFVRRSRSPVLAQDFRAPALLAIRWSRVAPTPPLERCARIMSSDRYQLILVTIRVIKITTTFWITSYQFVNSPTPPVNWLGEWGSKFISAAAPGR
jgi:hypothetical protein